MAAALALKNSLTQPTANGWRKWFVHHTDSHSFSPNEIDPAVCFHPVSQ